MIEIRKFEPDDTDAAIKIWNEVVDDGVAFPQLDDLDHESGLAFFEEQTYTGIAVDSDANEIVGLYILHPNNVGRCGHICNARLCGFFCSQEENRLVNSWSLTV